MKKVTIAGNEFEVKETSNVTAILDRNGGYDSIFEAYKKPSAFKIGIWNAWNNEYKNIYDELGGIEGNIWISSKNIFKFTITFYIVDMVGYIHIFEITKEHQRYYTY